MCPHFHAHIRAASGAATCAQRMSVSSECHQKSWHEDAKRLARGPAGLLLHVQLSHHWLATRLQASVALDCGPAALKGTQSQPVLQRMARCRKAAVWGRKASWKRYFTHFFDKDTVCEPLFHGVSHFQGTGKHDTFSHLQVLRCLSQTDPR